MKEKERYTLVDQIDTPRHLSENVRIVLKSHYTSKKQREQKDPGTVFEFPFEIPLDLAEGMIKDLQAEIRVNKSFLPAHDKWEIVKKRRRRNKHDRSTRSGK